ncbi:MAG: acyl-CoA dehydrogenase [Deltaproteobacteria bacterium]|nr:MAG: acyl-CoA dehydrogenase [Deltaproteobacteria bacterium]
MKLLGEHLLDEEHVMIRETARRFAETEIKPNAMQWEEAGSYPRELHRIAADTGLLGVGFPEELGGAGGGALHLVMCVEGLMRGGSTGVTVGLGTHQIALPPLLHIGSREQQQRFIPAVLRGEKLAALAVTEPGAGSDVAGTRTRARRDGDHYVVEGEKLYISGGTRADELMTLVRTGDDPHGGLTFLLIPRASEGVQVSAPLRKTGWWASDTAEIRFDQVRVPVERRIGPEGAAFLALMRNFQMERISLAAYGVATAAIALEEAMRWSRERRAFGRPLTGFQVTRHRIADMATTVESARVFTLTVAAALDRGEYRVREVSMAKNIAARAAVEVTHEAVQLFGGLGYMRETLVERLSRDARLLPIGGGTEEIMKEIIARELDLRGASR